MCPHTRALTWLLLIYYATWISLSEFHMISCIPGSTHTSLSIYLYHILLQLSSVSVMHACVYPFIHSGVVVSLELPRPLSSRLAPWLRRFLILHLQVLYSMDTHTGISICGLPLWIQGNMHVSIHSFSFMSSYIFT